MSLIGKFALAFFLAGPTVAAAQVPVEPLSCEIGPLERQFGGHQWLVYGCSDRRSVVLVSPPDSPASPFVFIFAASDEGYKLSGEGNGDKTATSATFEEIKSFDARALADLFLAAEQSSKNLNSN